MIGKWRLPSLSLLEREFTNKEGLELKVSEQTHI